MTYEEAIQELEWIYQNGFENDIKIIGTDRILEAIRMGIEAIEKQIPKKMVDNTDKEWFECPTCGRFLITYYAGKRNHCKCGQAISWEEEK